MTDGNEGQMDEVGVLNLVSHSSYNGQHESQESQSSQATNNQGENCSTPNVSHPNDRLTKKKINKDLGIKHNSGHWTMAEHQTYVEFLEQHHSSTMQSQQNRKNNKIFKLMSQTIGTRSPSQCRSHHQKFNPYTSAGQKRIKKTRKRIINETQMQSSCNTVQIKPFFTPEVRPNLANEDVQMQLFDQEDQMLDYYDEPQRLRVRRYSLDNQDESYNYHQHPNNNYFNEYCYE